MCLSFPQTLISFSCPPPFLCPPGAEEVGFPNFPAGGVKISLWQRLELCLLSAATFTYRGLSSSLLPFLALAMVEKWGLPSKAFLLPFPILYPPHSTVADTSFPLCPCCNLLSFQFHQPLILAIDSLGSFHHNRLAAHLH